MREAKSHYPGYFWSATMGAHVVYESRLELARLLLADFDCHVAVIAAQPFLLQARVAGAPAVTCRTSCWCVRTGRCGWSTSSLSAGWLTRRSPRRWRGRGGSFAGTWVGARDLERGRPGLLANLRFIAGYRRPGLLPG